jgi:hypothetical protein
VRLSWDSKLEVYTLATLGHGTPIDSRDVGNPGPFILDAGISSSRRIADFWGLARATAARPKPAPIETAPALPTIEDILMPQQAPVTPGRASAENIIRRALKAAGLLRR